MDKVVNNFFLSIFYFIHRFGILGINYAIYHIYYLHFRYLHMASATHWKFKRSDSLWTAIPPNYGSKFYLLFRQS